MTGVAPRTYYSTRTYATTYSSTQVWTTLSMPGYVWSGPTATTKISTTDRLSVAKTSTITTSTRTAFTTATTSNTAFRLGDATEDYLAWWPADLVIKKDTYVYTVVEQWLRTILHTILIVAFRGVVTVYLTVVVPVVEVTRIEVKGRYYGPLPPEPTWLDVLTENAPLIATLISVAVVAALLVMWKRKINPFRVGKATRKKSVS